MTDTLSESHLTPSTPRSPFLPGTKIQFAWDSTSLGLFKTCSRLYQYTILEGWASTTDNAHLHFGGEFHSALEQFDRLLAEGKAHEDALRATIRALLERTAGWVSDTSTKAGRYKNRDTLVGLVLDYLDHFNPDPATTYIKSDGTPAVELSFSFELDWGPETSHHIYNTEANGGGTSWAQPYLLCGHLDRVVTFNSMLLVMDRKTTTTTLSEYYFAQYNPNNQMSLYTYAGRVILDAPIRGVIIDAAQIKLEEPNAFARGFTYRTEAQLQEWMEDLRSTLALAETYALNNYWPQNDTSCDKFGGCKFRGICSKDPNVRANFLKTDFVQLEESERWNPLKAR